MNSIQIVFCNTGPDEAKGAAAAARVGDGAFSEDERRGPDSAGGRNDVVERRTDGDRDKTECPGEPEALDSAELCSF